METTFTLRPSLRTIATRFLISLWRTAHITAHSSIKRKSDYISKERGKLKQWQRVSCERFSACTHTQRTFEYFATRTRTCALCQSSKCTYLQLCYVHIMAIQVVEFSNRGYKITLLHYLTLPNLPNSQNSIISFEYVDS